MTAGSAASRRVLARTPVAPLPASSPKRPTGITGRMSAPPETSSPEVCSFRLPQMCGFRLPLTHVVHPAAFAVHRDANARLREHVGEVDAGELAALVAIENLWRAITLERLVQRLDAEAGLERVGQALGQPRAARPVHHGDQGQKAPPQGDVGNIRAPHVVRPRDPADRAAGRDRSGAPGAAETS